MEPCSRDKIMVLRDGLLHLQSFEKSCSALVNKNVGWLLESMRSIDFPLLYDTLANIYKSRFVPTSDVVRVAREAERAMEKLCSLRFVPTIFLWMREDFITIDWLLGTSYTDIEERFDHLIKVWGVLGRGSVVFFDEPVRTSEGDYPRDRAAGG